MPGAIINTAFFFFFTSKLFDPLEELELDSPNNLFIVHLDQTGRFLSLMCIPPAG